MADYDIGAAFGAIEDELISSMIRNLKRHQVEEVTEGFEEVLKREISSSESAISVKINNLSSEVEGLSSDINDVENAVVQSETALRNNIIESRDSVLNRIGTLANQTVWGVA